MGARVSALEEALAQLRLQQAAVGASSPPPPPPPPPPPSPPPQSQACAATTDATAAGVVAASGSDRLGTEAVGPADAAHRPPPPSSSPAPAGQQPHYAEGQLLVTAAQPQQLADAPEGARGGGAMRSWVARSHQEADAELAALRCQVAEALAAAHALREALGELVAERDAERAAQRDERSADRSALAALARALNEAQRSAPPLPRGGGVQEESADAAVPQRSQQSPVAATLPMQGPDVPAGGPGRGSLLPTDAPPPLVHHQHTRPGPPHPPIRQPPPAGSAAAPGSSAGFSSHASFTGRQLLTGLKCLACDAALDGVQSTRGPFVVCDGDVLVPTLAPVSEGCVPQQPRPRSSSSRCRPATAPNGELGGATARPALPRPGTSSSSLSSAAASSSSSSAAASTTTAAADEAARGARPRPHAQHREGDRSGSRERRAWYSSTRSLTAAAAATATAGGSGSGSGAAWRGDESAGDGGVPLSSAAAAAAAGDELLLLAALSVSAYPPPPV